MEHNPQPIRQAVFMIPPKVHLLDITGPAHIFYEASGYGAPVELTFSAIGRQTQAVSSCSLAFHRLVPYADLVLEPGDLVFIPGLDAGLLLSDQFLAETRAFQYWLKKQHGQGVIICSVCTGAFLLAAAGLLDHRNCTTHWKFAERFKILYPKAKLQTSRLFVMEDRLYTSAGVASGIDLALYLVEQLWGAHLAARIAKEVVIYFRRAIDDPQLSVFLQYRNHLDDRIHQVQDLLSQSLDQRFSIEALAEKVNMSPRNLTRSFKKTTQLTIGAYLDKLRAERARQLIAGGHTLQAAALHCGLKSVSRLKQLLGAALQQ
ncbi:GlxA family transcriptional regulator [Mucilaginibacter lappiensis]|uniref:Transcriptional regulator GlxA family with amidase domain n=1 Tax=Mucilaginibacter lappiensis TaxID=354630 RepID=A0A841JFF2_9SPHI|nr:DJ-1/PfpI family protein [Mucilaginibacter lappiensis]MBB6128326.1 transcriptional regulator GlxA family with amidase domain [Mucilaginibacter lappiensis]